ncbi:MAG TPA: hypothetical protein VFS31_14515, partial [Chitinophagaceae bacterium]|nr:hypothetical protein [Chitinophagaceae bacterium]
LPQPISHFQIGLASTWIIPDNSDNKTQPLCPPGTYARENWEKGRGPTFKDVFQTIEGGLGIWGSTQFRAGYRSPKFQIVGVPDCYTGNYLISPGWGNRTTATAPDKMGVAQLSNHILTPPDGFTFHDNPHGELFGYSWMSLPFSEAKPGPPPTGNRYWTLFFSTKNFKGPVAFIIPDSWSKVSADYPFDYGRGLDSREGHAGGGAQEINTVPYFEEKDENGVVYSKIPSFLYPVADNGETILIQDIRYYSDKALANSIDSWRKGGKASTGRFNVKPGASVLAKVRALPFSFHQTKDRIPLTGFEKDVQTTVFNDSLAFGLKWSKKGLNHTTSLPQYFKSTGNERVAVDESEVPVSLAHKTFEPAHNGNTYLSPNTGVWTNPGPAAGPFYTYLTDGSKITYYWYKFIDQPSLQQYREKW